MKHIVKSELAPAAWQKTADLTGLVLAIILLAVLGVTAAISASSTVSAVIAALVGLSAAFFAAATYVISPAAKN